MINESIYLNSHLLQETKQQFSSSHRSLEIGNHKRSFHYQAGHLASVSSGLFNLSYDYTKSSHLAKRGSNVYSQQVDHENTGLPSSVKTSVGDRSYLERLNWDTSRKLTSYTSNWPLNAEEKKWDYTSRGQLKSSPEGAYAFDFGHQGNGIRTAAPGHFVSSTGIDPFGRVTSEMINGSLLETSYDKQGQIQQRDQGIFHWDAFGRLTGIDEKDYTWKAAYDALGRRLQTLYQTEFDVVSTQSFYDPDHEFREIGVKIGDKTFWKIYGEEKCEAVMDEEGHLCELMHDALGNLVGVILLNEVHWVKDLPSSYGVIKDSTSEAIDLLSFAQSLAWQSFYQDPTGLIWMGARYYDPRAGRFLSSDPIGYPVGLDLYGYANGDPVNYRDPDGRFFSAAYQKMGAVVINTLNNPRFQGSVQAFGGLVEAGVGAGMTYTTGGFAAPLGWPVMAYGLDHFITDVSTAISGRSRDSLTAQILYKTGFSAETSRTLDNGIGFLGSLGGTASLAQKSYSALNGFKFPNGLKDSEIFGLIPKQFGNTGRFIPNNLREKLFMEETISNPKVGEVIKYNLNDPRWPGWCKMARNYEGIEVHYVAKWENGVIKAIDDFKFKDKI